MLSNKIKIAYLVFDDFVFHAGNRPFKQRSRPDGCLVFVQLIKSSAQLRGQFLVGLDGEHVLRPLRLDRPSQALQLLLQRLQLLGHVVSVGGGALVGDALALVSGRRQHSFALLDLENYLQKTTYLFKGESTFKEYYIVVFLDLFLDGCAALFNVPHNFCVLGDECEDFSDDAEELLSEKKQLPEARDLVLDHFDQVILLF